jgi:hypothetical protein
MLVFLMPAEVRRSFMVPPGVITAAETSLGALRSVRGRDWQATEDSSLLPPIQAHVLRGHSRTLAQTSDPAPDGGEVTFGTGAAWT